jgi:hypothetical protein
LEDPANLDRPRKSEKSKKNLKKMKGRKLQGIEQRGKRSKGKDWQVPTIKQQKRDFQFFCLQTGPVCW